MLGYYSIHPRGKPCLGRWKLSQSRRRRGPPRRLDHPLAAPPLLRLTQATACWITGQEHICSLESTRGVVRTP